MSEQSHITPAEAMASFFDVRAEGYDAHMRHNCDLDRLYGAVAAQLPETHEPIAILDLGCGTGMELHSVFRRAPNARITCIDVSAGMLDILRRNYAERAAQITTVQGSYADWAYPQQAFDCALSTYSLHHFLPERKTDIYRDILGTLKSGGCYIEADYMVREAQMEEALQEYHRRMAQLGGDSGDYHIDIPFTPEVQRGLLRDAGFVSVEITLDLLDSEWTAAVLRADK